ncbi:TetR/AcrR family transcriptional regulator [Celeribacter neptunius]|nr:TetR/AcrR family transcriptional regulator [Celeribacter neptunius]
MTQKKQTGSAVTGVGRKKEDRLAREDWFDAGLRLLGQSGPGGIRVDQVCKAMKVTKGSFYWHFQDRREFLDSLFDFWRARETSGLIAYVEGHYEVPEDRIWHVVEFVTLGTYDVASEVAMRQWGQSDDMVRAGLTKVDEERLGFFTRQFEACGFSAEAARMRAISVYSYTLSCGYMITGESPEALRRRLRSALDMLLSPDGRM